MAKEPALVPRYLSEYRKALNFNTDHMLSLLIYRVEDKLLISISLHISVIVNIHLTTKVSSMRCGVLLTGYRNFATECQFLRFLYLL